MVCIRLLAWLHGYVLIRSPCTASCGAKVKHYHPQNDGHRAREHFRNWDRSPRQTIFHRCCISPSGMRILRPIGFNAACPLYEQSLLTWRKHSKYRTRTYLEMYYRFLKVVPYHTSRYASYFALSPPSFFPPLPGKKDPTYPPAPFAPDHTPPAAEDA